MYKRSWPAVLFVISVFAIIGIGQIPNSPANDTGLGGSNAITGVVYSVAGAKLERRISIRLRTMMRGDRVTSTDEYGNFTFRGLVSGDYVLVIDKEKDFEPFTQAVTVIQVRGFPPQTYNLSIRLTRKTAAVQKTGVVNAPLANLPERGRELFARSRELQAAGNTAGAIEQLETLTAEYPDFMLGFNELGVQFLRLRQYDKADTAFKSALKLEPDAFAPQVNRGIALVSLKRYAEAETVLLSAKKVNDQHAPVRYFLGQAQANLGKFDDAEKELSAAVQMGGNEMAEAHRILAIIYSSRGAKDRAAKELDEYLSAVPSAPDADKLRSVIRQLKGLEAPAPATPPARSHP